LCSLAPDTSMLSVTAGIDAVVFFAFAIIVK
jgi:hypothetical protein